MRIANGIGILCARFNCNALMTVNRHIVGHLYVSGSNSVASRCGKKICRLVGGEFDLDH